MNLTSAKPEYGPAGSNPEGPILPWTQPNSSPIGAEWPSSGPNRGSNSGKVFFQEGSIDRKRRFRPFGGRDDDPLHRARGVTRNVEPRQMRGLIGAGAHGPLLVELAPERQRERRPLRLPGREKQRTAWQRIARLEDDAFERV